MSAGNTFENELLLLIFNNDAVADIGDASGLQPSSADGNLYVALHTANPGEAGNQSTSEVSYTGYAREAVPRTTGGWTVSANSVDNAAAITFGECTAGSATATHFSIGTAASGTGKIIVYSSLTASLAIGVGIIPEFAIGGLSVDLD